MNLRWMLPCVTFMPFLSRLPASAATNAAASPSGTVADAVCVELARTPSSYSDRCAFGPTLARELLRQAWLIAARDELGAFTRDGVLREEADHSDRVTSFTLKNSGVTLQAYKVGEPKPIWKWQELRGQSYLNLAYTARMKLADEFCKGEFREAMIRCGVPARPSPPAHEKALPPTISRELDRFDWVSLFNAIRSIHALIHEEGESPEYLGGLVRGYAKLALLTDRHWSVAHKAFLARALLYAQRLVSMKEQPDAHALAHRAYALTLAGLHADALEDLARVKDVGGGGLPGWVAVLESACRFENARLEKLAEGRTAEAGLALLLRVTQDEYSILSPRIADLVAESLLKRFPDCMRLASVLNEQGTMNQKHVMAAYGLQIVDESVRDRLARLDGLPSAVAGQLAKLESPTDGQDVLEVPGWTTARAELVRRLVEAGDPSADPVEFSWTVLGRLVEEEFFAQIAATTFFTRVTLCIAADDFVVPASRLIQGHPCLPYLLYRGYDRGQEQLSLLELEEMPVPDADIQLHDLFWILADRTSPAWKRSANFAMYRDYEVLLDDTSRDLTVRASPGYERLAASGHQLLSVSPYNPAGPAKLIASNWEHAQDRVSGWESTFADHPVFLAALALHYAKADEPDKAVTYYKRLNEIEPSMSNLSSLADLFRKQGKDAEFLAAAKAALEYEETGLEHTNVRIRLAEFYMEKKDFEKALDYARQAAESGSGGGLVCLAECYEAMGDFARAEAVTKECAEHYRDAARWFFWCKRTGRGDLEAARAFAVDTFADLGADSVPTMSPNYGTFLLLTDKPNEALRVFEAGFEKTGWMSCGMQAVLLADRMELPKIRDRMIDRILYLHEARTKSKIADSPLPDLARLLKKAIDEKDRLDAAAVDAWLDGVAENVRPICMYYAAVAMEQRGDEKRARAYMVDAARNGYPEGRETLLARERCVRWGLSVTTTSPESTGTGGAAAPATKPASPAGR